MSSSGGQLTLELLELMEHEKIIEQGLATFVEVGWALLRIRDGKKYRAAGYASFEDYCQGRWRMADSRARQLIRAVRTVEAIETGTAVPVLPQSERQVRALAPLVNEPELAARAWERAVESADGEQPSAATVAEAVKHVREPQPVEKRDHGGRPHPAIFSEPILPVMAELLDGYHRVLDPFAGTGRIHRLAEHGWDTVGVELEPEWAAMHERTRLGNALRLDFPDTSFDAIATSPTYGNRFADSYQASDPQARRSYRFDLGRELHSDNSGGMQWGQDYRNFHERAWTEALRVLRPGGRFVLNIKDHIRDGRWIDVAGWHVDVLTGPGCGLRVRAIRPIPIGGIGLGTNADRRAGAELVIALDRP